MFLQCWCTVCLSRLIAIFPAEYLDAGVTCNKWIRPYCRTLAYTRVRHAGDLVLEESLMFHVASISWDGVMLRVSVDFDIFLVVHVCLQQQTERFHQ